MCIRLSLRVLASLAIATLLSTGTLFVQAQVPAPPTPAPIPAALLSAKKLFLSNAGADSGLFPQPFSGDPSRAYNQLYAALQSQAQYELVADPSNADVVAEIQLTAPNGPSHGSKQNGASDPVPMFRLTLYDRKTHYILWALTSSIEIAFLQKTHDRNFDEALNLLLDEFNAVCGHRAAAH